MPILNRLTSKQLLLRISLFILLVAPALTARAQSQLASDLRQKVDGVARKALETTGVPSASIAIVKDGQIAYLQAYGNAKTDPPMPARPEMRYSIGSISKQFTATAILMLAEQGKLSLDDPVSRFLPTLTRAGEVTIRQLLAHTSGYQDYWPQDYVFPLMMQPITAEKLLDLWARKPLDFDPGTQRQYSNTGFVIAGLIVEKAAGMPLLQFLRERVFTPLVMDSVVDVDQNRLSDTDPAGYMRYALGPLRVAPKEGQGWLFAAGELAMTARDLAKWNIGLIEQKLLKLSSYQEMETEVLLKNGVATHYGLGIGIRSDSGRRVLEHGGEVSGFTAENLVFPDHRAAITVLTNADAAEAATSMAQKITPLIFAVQDATAAKFQELARKIFADLQRGTINRSLFTGNGNSYFSEQALRDFSASLAPLGAPREFTQIEHSERGGMSFWAYQIRFARKTLVLTVRAMPDGKIEQYQIAAVD
jgi:CubicO group peptidase (beta-lactamase class C family)